MTTNDNNKDNDKSKKEYDVSAILNELTQIQKSLKFSDKLTEEEYNALDKQMQSVLELIAQDYLNSAKQRTQVRNELAQELEERKKLKEEINALRDKLKTVLSELQKVTQAVNSIKPKDYTEALNSLKQEIEALQKAYANILYTQYFLIVLVLALFLYVVLR